MFLLKLGHVLKMSWMFTWRLLIVGVILFRAEYNDYVPVIGFLLACIMVIGYNKTLFTFPLIRLIRRQPFVGAAGGGYVKPVRPPQSKKSATPPQKKDDPFAWHKFTKQLDGATENGRMTGFEPSILERRPVPFSAMMLGEPGEGLHQAESMTAERISLGVRGEQNFARALRDAGQLERFRTAWSVLVPDFKEFKPGPYGTDIDCVIATGNSLYLVDLKNYKSGNVRYFNQNEEWLDCEDIPTGHRVGDVKEMSRNMEMAAEAVRTHFPRLIVKPVVVFMPTDKGEGIIDDVKWPGDIPGMNLTEFLSKLVVEPEFNETSPSSVPVIRLSILRSRKKK